MCPKDGNFGPLSEFVFIEYETFGKILEWHLPKYEIILGEVTFGTIFKIFTKTIHSILGLHFN